MTQEQMRNLNTIVETYGNDAQDAAMRQSERLQVLEIFRFSQTMRKL